VTASPASKFALIGLLCDPFLDHRHALFDFVRVQYPLLDQKIAQRQDLALEIAGVVGFLVQRLAGAPRLVGTGQFVIAIPQDVAHRRGHLVPGLQRVIRGIDRAGLPAADVVHCRLRLVRHRILPIRISVGLFSRRIAPRSTSPY